VAVEDVFDGSERANHIQYYRGQGGPPIAAHTDTASIARYGEYWAQQFFPAQTEAPPVTVIAEEQLVLRKSFKQTLTVHPAPERSPEPFVDYYLGDRVRVNISENMRQGVGPQSTLPAPATEVDTVWQRVYGIPVNVDDNGVETVTELLVGPIGAPPPPTGGNAAAISNRVAVTTARTVRRGPLTLRP